jgi:hypothetical protein
LIFAYFVVSIWNPAKISTAFEVVTVAVNAASISFKYSAVVLASVLKSAGVLYSVSKTTGFAIALIFVVAMIC